MEKEIIHFKLGREHYGLEIDNVLEIIKDVKITKIPNSPANLLGIVNVRGKINNVMNLSKILGLDNKDENNYFLICSDNFLDEEGKRNEIVFPITDVSDIVRISEENKVSVENNKSFISSKVDYIVKQDKELITVLNYKKLFE